LGREAGRSGVLHRDGCATGEEKYVDEILTRRKGIVGAGTRAVVGFNMSRCSLRLSFISTPIPEKLNGRRNWEISKPIPGRGRREREVER